MPKWGLTPAMRATRPWGLAEKWLAPGKIVTDPVHGDIYLTTLEVALVDTPPFQRLRRVRQLGATHLVYPGATHSRFAHSLGAVKVAQELVDTVVEQRSGLDPQLDLFTQWEVDLQATSPSPDGGLSTAARRELDKKIGEVTVLARLGALLHDLCHVPFGHSIEDDLELLTPHDENVDRFDRLWKQIPLPVRKAISSANQLEQNLRPLILSKAEKAAEPRYPFVEDIVGNTICADLLDYLRRDHLYTGLPISLGRRFTSGYYVMPYGDQEYGQHMVLRVHRHKVERQDVITEILKHLRYRYELSERALVHKTKLAADAMIGKALEMWHDALWIELASHQLAGEGDDAPELPAGDDKAAIADELANAGHKAEAIKVLVKAELERVMTLHGDDGLLEYLCELVSADRPTAQCDEGRRAAVASLAVGLRDHALYKRIGFQRHTRRDRVAFHKQYGKADAKRTLEQAAARFAGVSPSWRVVVWLPSPKMRLKVAEVIVDDGEEIRKFVDREKEGRRRGTDIYDAHEDLWGVSVFADSRVGSAQRTLVLASLSADLDIQFGDLDERLGPLTHEWPDRLAIKRLARDRKQAISREQANELLATRLRNQRAARTAGRAEHPRPSIGDLATEYGEILDS
jgi:HD superfamily phosphohydrolase